MKISLIHPSRGRPQKAWDTAMYWIAKSVSTVEHIISIDADDTTMSSYVLLFNNKQIINLNTSVVDATNKAAKLATGDILVYLSDDFLCPQNWDQMIIEEFKNENRPLLIKVDDCLQPKGTPVLTIPIMNRPLYEKLGYFWHPGYKSMFVDEDLYWTSRKLNALKNSEHLQFPHHHVSVGKAEHDDTYKRSERNWDSGKAFFQQRKAAGFPL